MYEEYLEDYVYRLIAKIASRMCYAFKTKKTKDEKRGRPVGEENADVIDSEKLKAIDNGEYFEKTDGKSTDSTDLPANETDDKRDSNIEQKCDSKNNSIDEDLNSINFHMMMFFLWMCVTLVNIPALLTWARNFKYSIILKPDTSYYTGFIMSACSAIIWQMKGPRMNLKHYEDVASLLFTMAVFILVLGPFSLTIVNYGVTVMFAIITIQQLIDTDDSVQESIIQEQLQDNENIKPKDEDQMEQEKDADGYCTREENLNSKEDLNTEKANEGEDKPSDCDECSENRIFNIFQNLREKFSFGND